MGNESQPSSDKKKERRAFGASMLILVLGGLSIAYHFSKQEKTISPPVSEFANRPFAEPMGMFWPAGSMTGIVIKSDKIAIPGYFWITFENREKVLMGALSESSM